MAHGPNRQSDRLPFSVPDETGEQAYDWKADVTWAFRSTRVVTSEGLRPATILVNSGKIVDIAAWADVPAHFRDYGDHVLLPGLVDTHVHINDAETTYADTGHVEPDLELPGISARPTRQDWEGFRTATQAAAVGGVTTLVDMPLNCVPETISVAALEQKRRAAIESWVDWMSWGGIVGHGGLHGNEAKLPELIEAGVPGFKCFLIHSGIDGFAWVDEQQLRKAMAVLGSARYRDLRLPLLAHAELAAAIEQATESLNELPGGANWRSYATYLASRPDQAEVDAIELLISLAADFDIPVHIVHLATAQALPALKKARESGLKITVETCPHYLWFASETIPDGGTEWKCAPPIRTSANREALWQALLHGQIDMIATDHSPCPPALKRKDTGRFDEAWGGIASLGLALSVIWTGLNRHIRDSGSSSLESLVRWLATEPARLAGLTGRKGALAPGYDADIVVFDPNALWTVTEADLQFRHKLSPYLGEELQGRVLETYLRGECIFWSRDLDSTDHPHPDNPTPERPVVVIDPQAHGCELGRVASEKR